MINIENKELCCGCGACVNACPKNCIHMEYDEEGFTYPVINKNKCVNCGLCDKVCHMNYDIKNQKLVHPQFYAGYNKDAKVMKESSSGGIFWLLVENIIEDGGVVYGAALEEGIQVAHSRGNTLEECKKFRKSKYLQSDTKNTYKEVKADLDRGIEVLYSGTPCQIAGLYSYLGKNYDKLYTVDVVCHGVPSRGIFDLYMNELQKKKKAKPISVCWRDKRDGWGPNKISIQFDNNEEVISTSMMNPVQKGFLLNLYLRPSCYKCKYARLPRIGDISLADFWNYEGELTIKNRNQGLSMIIVSSDKGKELFEKISNKLECHETTEEYAKSKSRHVYIHPNENVLRDDFMKDYIEGKDFRWLNKHYMNKKMSFGRRVINRINRIINK